MATGSSSSDADVENTGFGRRTGSKSSGERPPRPWLSGGTNERPVDRLKTIVSARRGSARMGARRVRCVSLLAAQQNAADPARFQGRDGLRSPNPRLVDAMAE